MAWNPNIPTVTNRVQDDLNAIRENFQHLDQLAERVDELQTVSGLAQITDDLQVVSELAPYVQAIIDSRIVEMGSNSNGTYVRWENGLQLCWHSLVLSFAEGSSQALVTWTYPAAFSAVPFLSVTDRPGIGNVLGYRATEHSTNKTVTSAEIVGNRTTTTGSANLGVTAIAVGRWK